MNNSFENWIQHMFTENCIERKAHGETPYASISDYYEKNHSFLVKLFREENPLSTGEEK